MTQIQGSTGLVKVEGRFTFEDHEHFKAATKGLIESHGISEIDVDLSGASYLDSNALGMLIGLREKAKGRNILIKLLRPSPAVKTILDMVQFERVFSILE